MSLPANTITPSHLSQPPKPPPSSAPNPTQPILSNQSRYKERSFSLHQTHNPTVSWTSSISRHCRNGRMDEAVEVFPRMRLAGVEPNHITFVTLLSASADYRLKSVCFGVSIHGYARKLGLDTGNVMVGTALVAMYAKFGLVDVAKLVFDKMGIKNSISWNTTTDGYMQNGKVEYALKVFDEMPERDAISWTALIGGFVKRAQFEQALEWFLRMQLLGVKPDYVTLIAVLAACADLGTLG